MNNTEANAVQRRWNADLPDSIFDQGGPGRRGLTFPKWDGEAVDFALPADVCRTEPADLPALSEPEVMRHFTKLSTLNHHIERGMYPLGSCTMMMSSLPKPSAAKAAATLSAAAFKSA